MTQTLHLTRTSRAVIAALARSPEELWGQRICRETQLPSATVYPLLARLAELGWTSSRWEDDDDRNRRPGPRRRLWRLTDKGRIHAAAALAAAEERAVLQSLNGDHP